MRVDIHEVICSGSSKAPRTVDVDHAMKEDWDTADAIVCAIEVALRCYDRFVDS